MSNYLKIIALVSLVICMSCEELGIYNCNNCLDYEPLETNIEIRIKSSGDVAPTYQIKVFKGRIEDNLLVMDVSTTTSIRYRGMINQEYSAMATVVMNGVQYNIISSTIPRVVDQSDYCESTCFIVKNNEIDLRLKYH